MSNGNAVDFPLQAGKADSVPRMETIWTFVIQKANLHDKEITNLNPDFKVQTQL